MSLGCEPCLQKSNLKLKSARRCCGLPSAACGRRAWWYAGRRALPNFAHPRTFNQKTSNQSLYSALDGNARISVANLLELSHWCQRYQSTTQGRDQCETTQEATLKKGLSTVPAERTLETDPRCGSKGDQPHPGTDDCAASASTGHEGGAT